METLRFEDKMYIKHTLNPFLFKKVAFIENIIKLSNILNKMPDKTLLNYLLTTLK